MDTQFRITEIFYSLQGESTLAGLPTVFVRLSGCPLRCGYCDTEYSFRAGQWMALARVLEQVASYRVGHVCVTGGEPLAQRDCPKLLSQLCDAGYRVSLETSGAIDIGGLDERLIRVMDLKTPGSGEVEKNRWENIGLLTGRDQVKLVICDRTDYEWAVERLREHQLNERCEVLFSPVWGQQDATELAEWILNDKLPVRFQLQLHKLLWGQEPGR